MSGDLHAPAPAEVRPLTAADLCAALPEFAALLHACVHAGASVNFVMPFPPEEAAAIWRERVLPGLEAGRHAPLTLDTCSGDAAEPLYLSLGYRIAGRTPGYSRDPHHDRLDATTILYKTL